MNVAEPTCRSLWVSGRSPVIRLEKHRHGNRTDQGLRSKVKVKLKSVPVLMGLDLNQFGGDLPARKQAHDSISCFYFPSRVGKLLHLNGGWGCVLA